MSDTKKTTDCEDVRRWAEERGGRPATVEGTEGGDDAGVLRIDFQDPDEGLKEISWEDFCEKFSKEKLAFLYQDETKGGDTSRFFKFVSADG
jgi:hypothetical protein